MVNISLHSPFVVIKLKTGETLFAEITNITEDNYSVRNPRLVKIIQTNTGNEALFLDSWIPYTDDEIFDLGYDIVYYIGNLNDIHTKHYGSCLMREEIIKINKSGNGRLRDGEFTGSVYKDVIQQMKDLGEEYSIKYGIPPETPLVSREDLSEDRILN